MAGVKQGQPPDLPEPPQIKRKIAFYPTQAIGMPILLLIPLLGLFGQFDTRQASVSASMAGLEMTVRYPTRFRHKVGEPMQISVQNATGAMVPTLVVTLSKSYLDAFENVVFIPEPVDIDADSIRFEFDNVRAGETRQVEIEMESSRAGTVPALSGSFVEGGQGPSVKFQTLVLP